MTRKQALKLIELAIAENDTATATRIYCENRISRAAYNKACDKGKALKVLLSGRPISTTVFNELGK